MLDRMLNSIYKLGGNLDRIKIFATLQPPFTGKEDCLKFLDGWVMDEPCGDGIIPFARYRRKVLELASEHGVDWFWSMGDDHIFSDSGGDLFTKTCEEYHRDVFDWLDENDDVGAISLKGYVGGYSWGYDFCKMPRNGIVATDKGGFMVRNIGVDKILPLDEAELVGALFESMAVYNVMWHDYKFAVRFNSPTKCPNMPGQSKRIGGSRNKSYSDDTINNNLQGKIRHKFADPTWDHSSKKYPLVIIQIAKDNNWEYNDRS